MAKPFEVGDIVKLKSGGPPMTVEEVRDKNANNYGASEMLIVDCQWFAGSKIQHGSFYPEVLEKVDTSTSPKAKKD